MDSESTGEPANTTGRWKQALEAYDDALFNARHRRWATAVDRAYYASFYGVLACLALKDKRPKTHKGSARLFSKLFIKPGKMDTELIAKFNHLMENRIEADYTLGKTFDEKEVEKILIITREILEEIYNYLSTKLTCNLPQLPNS